MAKKFVLCLLCFGILTACGPPRYKKQIIEDPLSPSGHTNYLIFHEDGSKSVVLEDPLSPEHYRNYLLFDGQGQADVLLEDPLSPKDFRNYLLYEKGGD